MTGLVTKSSKGRSPTTRRVAKKGKKTAAKNRRAKLSAKKPAAKAGKRATPKATRRTAKSPAKKAISKKAVTRKPAAKKARKALKRVAKKPAARKPIKKVVRKIKKTPAITAGKRRPAAKRVQARHARPSTRPVKVAPPPKPVINPVTAAAVKAFEGALKLFNRHQFERAKEWFDEVLETYPEQLEIVARTRTYLNICDQKLASAPTSPRGPDALYNRGVVELNRGNAEEATALFEKALKSEPRAAHVLYSLAAAQARMNNQSKSLDALRRAISIQPVHRPQARSDVDFTSLRENPEFQRLTGYGLEVVEE